MLKYLIILLDDTSISYCQYNNEKAKENLIPLEYLKKGILFGMKENLMVQFVYPDYILPQDYKNVINDIDHCDIVSSRCEDKRLTDSADVIIFKTIEDALHYPIKGTGTYTIRTSKDDLINKSRFLSEVINSSKRVNIVITDIDKFTEPDFERYNYTLSYLSEVVKNAYAKGKSPQLNILTDRMQLDFMNNCNAGAENVTIAPDGNFYVCPAFYYAGLCSGNEKTLGEECQKGYSIGSLSEGLDLKNPQLYTIEYAPLCRNCDSYQCKRCVWLNRKTTFEINTPSHEQCVVAHLERNASRKLLADIRTLGSFLPDKEIKNIDYLDPFDIRMNFK